MSDQKTEIPENLKPSSHAKVAPTIDAQADTGVKTKTMSSLMGEIVWLMSQSPAHKHFALADLEWMLMPAIALKQVRLFKDDNKQPVGCALWAYLSPEAEEKLNNINSRIMPHEWGNNASFSPEAGLTATEGGTLWLVDLIAPFATEENNLIQKILAELMQTSFKGKQFKFHQTDPKTGKREVKILGTA
jgi:cytolysin-activating lysine-acyltransferase